VLFGAHMLAASHAVDPQNCVRRHALTEHFREPRRLVGVPNGRVVQDRMNPAGELVDVLKGHAEERDQCPGREARLPPAEPLA
jgi:hypothetical protein